MAETLSKVNDNKIRLILIPFFGIIIPNLAGLFYGVEIGTVLYWLGYIYFIFVSYTIYQGNRFLLFKQREHYNWFANPVQKLILLVFANIFYTAPVTVAMIAFWFYFAGFGGIDWEKIEVVTLMNVIAVIFVTHVYETVFLIKERESDRLQFEKLERAKAQAELEALKTQIDPHFMFNSLNTLSWLIEHDPQKALRFNESLADVYRYILMHKDKELVPLDDELDFLNSYFELIKLRFGDGIQMDFRITDAKNLYIPPISLQILLENVVKHNEFDTRHPLYVDLRVNDQEILFSNKIREKRTKRISSKNGLKNLAERYRLVTEKEIKIENQNSTFMIKLPLVNI